MVTVIRQTAPHVARETDWQEAEMKSDETPNPWQVLNAVSQRISQGFGVQSNLRSDLISSHVSKSIGSLEEASRRTVEQQLAGADIKPISSWLRQS
jgi:hypothetical protein